MGCDLRGLKLTGGERLIEWDLAGEQDVEDDEEDELDSLLLLPESSRFAAAEANTLLDPDPAPREPLGE